MSRKMHELADRVGIGPDRSVLAGASPGKVRRLIREGRWRWHTAGLCEGFAQANLVIIPNALSEDFLRFCRLNPKPCPVLEVIEKGEFVPRRLAPGADVRTDLPLYRVYEDGKLLVEVTEIVQYWRDDLTAVLIGCSYTFDHALMKAGIPLRHVQEGRNVPMFVTDVACKPAGIFRGPMVVSMRLIPKDLVARTVEVTGQFDSFHGAPVEVGDPLRIGIADMSRPDWGEPTPCAEDEVPVFWACGVTPQAAALHSKIPFMITHSPGHMLITDMPHDEVLGPPR